MGLTTSHFGTRESHAGIGGGKALSRRKGEGDEDAVEHLRSR